MAISVNDSGTLRQLSTVHANENGTLRELNTVYANENGTLRTIHEGVPPLSSVSITRYADGYVGDWYSFGYTYSPSNAKVKSVSWSSDNSSIIKMDSYVAMYVGKGSTYVNVEVKDIYGYTRSSSVYVRSYLSATSVSISQSSVSAKRGAYVSLSFKLSPSNAEYGGVYFSSSNLSVIEGANYSTFRQQVKKTAKIGDTATITVHVIDPGNSMREVTDSCTITVVG